MSQQNAEYTNVQRAARELFEGTEPGKVINIGGSKITLSKVRHLEAGAEMPAPYPEVDLPPADDYVSWLK